MSDALTTVWCVLCIDRSTSDETVHIFSTRERALAFAETDSRAHVLYDYVIDCPERMERRADA